MKLHKFTCTECSKNPFYTSFEPAFEDAFCPCCGQDKTVSYQGVIDMREVQQRAQHTKISA